MPTFHPTFPYPIPPPFEKSLLDTTTDRPTQHKRHHGRNSQSLFVPLLIINRKSSESSSPQENEPKRSFPCCATISFPFPREGRTPPLASCLVKSQQRTTNGRIIISEESEKGDSKFKFLPGKGRHWNAEERGATATTTTTTWTGWFWNLCE